MTERSRHSNGGEPQPRPPIPRNSTIAGYNKKTRLNLPAVLEIFECILMLKVAEAAARRGEVSYPLARSRASSQ